MKDRTIICEFYICRGKCSKDRDANYNGLCQRCPFYIPKKNAKPFRIDNRKKKLEKISKSEKFF